MSYLSRAKLLDQDVDRLQKGETVRSVVTVNSLDEYKKLFADNLTPEYRSSFDASTLVEPGNSFHPILNHVYGDGMLTNAHLARKIHECGVLALN